jgi:hypothetical protein
VLSSLNLDCYDEVIAELRKKNAEKETAKAKATEGARKLEEASRSVLARLPEIEARSFSSDYRHLTAVEALLSDGVVPPNLNNLFEEFERGYQLASECQKAIIKLTNTLAKPLSKVDANTSVQVRRLLSDLVKEVRPIITHYRRMALRVKEILKQSKSVSTGPIQRAYDGAREYGRDSQRRQSIPRLKGCGTFIRIADRS